MCEATPASGVYALLLTVAKPTIMRIGQLGVFQFTPGTYVYVGSARRGLLQRILRHLRRGKKKRWHIDYLTTAKETRVSAALTVAEGCVTECKLSRKVKRMLRGTEPLKGFGSSDCMCVTHLHYCGEVPPETLLKRLRKEVRSMKAQPHHAVLTFGPKRRERRS